MGGDISVFEEDQLENDLEFLSKNESLMDLFNRSLSDMTDVMTQPKRYMYDSAALQCTQNECLDYRVEEFGFHCEDGVVLSCAKWVRDESSNVCVIYTHTNMRAKSDATEVLPLCNILKANLMAYDSRGCGKSGGTLSLRGSRDLSNVIAAMVKANPDLEIVIWSRGISTHIAIELLSSGPVFLSHVQFLVLDSPFTSFEEIVSCAATDIHTCGIVVPSVFVNFAVQLVRKNIKKKLGIDPYAIKPMLLAGRVRIPCFVLAADDDEYIPSAMGERIHASWGGDCFFREFPGSHFVERDECLVMTPVEKILCFVSRKEELVGAEREAEGGRERTWREGADDEHFERGEGEMKVTTPSKRAEESPRDDVVWTPKSVSLACSLCREPFSALLRRKHHCRMCGCLVCDACSQNRHTLQREGCASIPAKVPPSPLSPVRVCDACNNIYLLSL